jgi:uncharacterized membrane protein YgcG
MPDAEPLPSRRGRRILIALLMLLLILLPLYLWPLRGPGGLPGASALPGSVPDPRSAAAIARIPRAVWDALMEHSGAPAPPSRLPPKAPGNLTMIIEVEEIPGNGLGPGPASLARGLIDQLGGPLDPSDGKPGDGAAASAPVEFLASSEGTGTGSSSSGFHFGSLGPWGGGGSSGGPRVSTPGPTFSPGEPGALEPTPEPATLALVGSNLVLLGGATYRRRRRRLRSGSMG